MHNHPPPRSCRFFVAHHVVWCGLKHGSCIVCGCCHVQIVCTSSLWRLWCMAHANGTTSTRVLLCSACKGDAEDAVKRCEAAAARAGRFDVLLAAVDGERSWEGACTLLRNAKLAPREPSSSPQEMRKTTKTKQKRRNPPHPATTRAGMLSLRVACFEPGTTCSSDNCASRGAQAMAGRHKCRKTWTCC